MTEPCDMECDECGSELYADPQGGIWCPSCDNMDPVEGLMRG